MKQKFVDRVEIYVRAGKGGDGCSSFYRDRRSRFPKPDGGNGGKGGDVLISVDDNLSSLLDLQYRKHFVAEKGKNGEGNDKRGKAGKDCFVKVPPGTLVKDAESGFILRDLTERGEKVLVARGGRAGLGNKPKHEATKGQPGQERKVLLELKLIADVGLIGYPNVGKSTLLNRISSANSKVGAYPFTTKSPILGCLVRDKEGITFTVADIPGLIKGAHRGRGLGAQFLRHIERTKILVHIVDISQSENRDAYEDYLGLNRELFLYNARLKDKPQILAANKIDLPEASENLARFSQKFKGYIYPISALKDKGIGALLEGIKEALG